MSNFNKLLDKGEDLKMGLIKYLEAHQHDDTVLIDLAAYVIIQEKRIEKLERIRNV